MAVAISLHAGPSGQVRSEQSAPVKPVKQEQTPQGVVHFPFPEQDFGHGVYANDEGGRAEMTSRAGVAIDARIVFFISSLIRMGKENRKTKKIMRKLV